MNEELNIKELLAELEVYRWRDKKAVILKELDLHNYISEYKRDEIIKAYEANRPFTLIDSLYISISKEADDLLSKGYTVDEIIRAVREWVKERLDEIEKEKEDEIEEALKRNEPMKVDLETKYALPYSRTYYKCPKCDVTIERWYNYCPYCGQKLDWSDVK